MVHYLKNYNPPGVVRVKCTLYEGPTQVRDKEGFPCQFFTRPAHPDEALTPNKNNLEKLQTLGIFVFNEEDFGSEACVIPFN